LGTHAYHVLSFGICNALATFQQAIIGIFCNLIHDCVDIYMDDFTIYGYMFKESIDSLCKFLERCQETNLSLSHENCHMLLIEGIVLGNHISLAVIKVDPTNIQVIINVPMPKTWKEVCSFLDHVGYYHRFVSNFTKIASPLFKLLLKDANFNWIVDCL
jgi:hypothetical protein